MKIATGYLIALSVFVLLFGASVFLYLYDRNRKRVFGVKNWKYVSSALFIIIAAVSVLANRGVGSQAAVARVLLMFGFCFSWVGDYMLSIPKWRGFSRGVAAFAAAHVGYTAAFCNISAYRFGYIFNLAEVAASVVFVLLTALLFRLRKYPRNFKTNVMQVYGAFLTVMAVKAVSLGFHIGGLAAPVFAVGGVMFLVSDFILLFIINEKKSAIIYTRLNLLTYYLSQLMLALGILFV